MTDATYSLGTKTAQPARPDLDGGTHLGTVLVFVLLLVGGLGYAVYGPAFGHQRRRRTARHRRLPAASGIALLIALGFEFVNGFHDTAQTPVAYGDLHAQSHPGGRRGVVGGCSTSLASWCRRARWPMASSPCFPVELILQVGSGAALRHDLLAADRRHHLELGHMGARHPQQLVARPDRLHQWASASPISFSAPAGQATSGVDWSQALNVGKCAALQSIDRLRLVRSAAARP